MSPTEEMHMSGIMHPLGSMPPGHIIISGPQEVGHIAGHIFPSMPMGPIEGMHMSGIWHPFQSIPPGHSMVSGPHSRGGSGKSGQVDGIAATALKISGTINPIITVIVVEASDAKPLFGEA